jgi:retron-type reverse transcriptase
MGLANIWTRNNLLLAWRRLNTGRNAAYKRYFRKLYYAYEIALDANIRDLHDRLKGGSFKPQQPTRVYLPKPSGLQRPITLLSIEDQIVLQVIANIFAEKVGQRRRRIELKSVFSNIVQPGRNSIFFLKNWQFSYSEFQKRIHEHFNAGYRWIAHFDLAAYYDTICHDMLLRTVFPRTSNTNSNRILEFLKKWSSEKTASCHGHGIPQGPIASDFLAECFLLPVDEALQKQRLRFVRYVDDVRLFARSKNELWKAAIRMEILLRERGLIPQGKKHAITHAKTLEDAMGILPSIEPRDDDGEAEERHFSPGVALSKFKTALSGKPLAITDKTRARYVLFHATPSRQLLNYVLRLMPRHPEHVDAFVQYLVRHRRSRRIVNACLELASSSPYEYVCGEMWHIMAQMMQMSEMKKAARLAVACAKNRDIGLALEWGVLHFLCVAERKGIGKYGRCLQHQDNALLQALLAPIIPDARYAKGNVVCQMLTRSAPEPGMALAEQLIRLRLRPSTFGIQTGEMPSQVRNTFRVLGLASQLAPRVDPMGEILHNRYQVQQWDGWKCLMGSEYSHALQLLSIADATYDMGRSQWLSYQNSFNHSLFLALQQWLKYQRLSGVVRTVGKDGRAVKFGTMVDRNQPFAKAHPTIAYAFAIANARRNTLPGSHPYQQSGRQRTQYLKKKEQATIQGDLARAYAEIIGMGGGAPLAERRRTGSRRSTPTPRPRVA